MAITSFQGVRDFINKFLADHKIGVSGAPHQDFWNTMSYNDFVTGNVPGLLDSAGLPLKVKILVKGKSAESWLIKVLQGPITASGVAIVQMPKNGDKMTKEQIAEIAGWIDNNCPQ
jgi:hypothetical protein